MLKKQKNLEIYKYMKKYVDRGGIMKQLNKRSVLFFKRVVSSTFFFSRRLALGKHCSTNQTMLSSEQFYYSPLVLLPQGKLFHKIVLHKNAFQVVVPAFHKSWGDPERKLHISAEISHWFYEKINFTPEESKKRTFSFLFFFLKGGTFQTLVLCNRMQMYQEWQKHCKERKNKAGTKPTYSVKLSCCSRFTKTHIDWL